MDHTEVKKVLSKHMSQSELDIWVIDSVFMNQHEYRKALRLKLPLVHWKKAWLTTEERSDQKMLKALLVKHNRNKAIQNRIVIDHLPPNVKIQKDPTCKYCKSPMMPDYLSNKVEWFCINCYAIRLPKTVDVPCNSASQTRRVKTASTPVSEAEFSRVKNFKSYLQRIQGNLGLAITKSELEVVKAKLEGREPEYELLRGILHELGFRHVYNRIHSLQKYLGFPLPVYSEKQMESILELFLEMDFDKKDKGLMHADILAKILENL